MSPVRGADAHLDVSRRPPEQVVGARPDVEAGSWPASLERFSPSVATAWGESFMASFPTHIAEPLIAQARVATVPAGEIFYRGAHHAEMATLALVVTGLLRTFIRAEDGREVTVQYAEPGAVVGVPAVVLGGASQESALAQWHWLLLGGDTLYGEAVQETVMLKFSPAQFRRLAETEIEVAWPLVSYLARRTAESQQMLAADLFLPIRARVARHLMDLAVRREGEFLVTASHQEIADAIGSVREVASRTLRRLRDEGVVDRRDGTIVILDPARLHAISQGE
jgi:CRP-like cAMP-binding protein